MSEYVIETENLTKKYKNQIVVDRLNPVSYTHLRAHET